MKTLNKKNILFVAGGAVFIILAAAALIYFFWTAQIFFYTPDGVIEHKAIKGSEVSLDTPADIKGYTFIGWEDEWGNMEQRQSIKLYEDTYYSAVYSVSLDTEEHEPYLFPDEYGLFRPNQLMTRGDAALMLYTLLAVDVKGRENYIDVPQNAPYSKATAALKELNISEGSRFHPEESISRYELMQMLASFFPPVYENAEFADIDKNDSCYNVFRTAAHYGWVESGTDIKAEPDTMVTRLDAALIMNRVLGRAVNPDSVDKNRGYVLDMSPSEKNYIDFAEATVHHNYENGVAPEHWTAVELPENIPVGFYLAGTELYFVTSKGYVLKDFSVGNFQFDENGRYTSGMPKLDKLVQQALSEIYSDDMDAEELLEAAYRYTVKNFSYLKGNLYENGDVSWSAEEAFKMLSNGCGNCYSFAGTFCQLAKALGFDAEVYSGTIGADRSKHGWVGIKIDGETYLFDPEMEMAYEKNHHKYIDMYMMTSAEARKWNYSY